MHFRVTSQFGVLEEVRGLKPHTGVDLAMPQGTKLHSVFDGTIEKVWNNTGNIGNGVKIKTDDGLHTIYGHMSKVDVNVGQHINAGQFVGLSGNTGHSTGPHLHFGMQKDDGTFIDPTKYADYVGGEHVSILKSAFNSPVGWFANHLLTPFEQHIKEKTIDIIFGVFDGLGEVLMESIGAISLIGCTVLIIMKIAGYDKGYKQAGMLFVFNIICRVLFGGDSK